MPEFLDLHGRTSKALRALTEAEMRRHGLHYGQDLVLAALWEHDGRTPGEVAAALHVTTPTIVKMATRMTAAGLLTRRRDDRDNRLVRLWLTEAGTELKEPVLAARQALEDKVTAGLADFYGAIADEVSRPGSGKLGLVPPPPMVGPAMPRHELGGDGSGGPEVIAPAYQLPHPHLLWVQEHLHHLSKSAQTVSEPALHMGEVRSRPWWR